MTCWLGPRSAASRTGNSAMDRKRRIRSYYESRLEAGRDHFKVLDWASPASQRVRFEVLSENVDLAGKTLLDVGCGLGDLLTYLKDRRIAVDYTGVDISEKLLAAARRAHPEATFLCADIFAEPTGAAGELFGKDRFDVVFVSGAFNLNLGNNSSFLPRAVGRMMLLASQCVAFNLLHAAAAAAEETYAYYDPDEVLASIRTDGWQALVIDGYLPNDFTVICRPVPPVAAG